MNKYLILYQSPVSASQKMANATPEQMQTSFRHWMDWKSQAEARGARIEFGMPMEGRLHFANDGTASPSQTQATGYMLIETDSLEAAQEIVSTHPHLQDAGSTIELLEQIGMPGISHN